MAAPAKISERVYQVGGSGISGPSDCSVYVVDAGDLVLIDSGAGSSFDGLVANMKKLGLNPGKLTAVIATHRHIDHIGALRRFKDVYGAKVIAHEKDVPGIESGINTGAEFYGVEYQKCVVDVRLRSDAAKLRLGDLEFNFIHIPGHTPGSLAVYLDIGGARVLFGQDIHGPYMEQWGGNRAEAAKSLQKLLDLKADILCEGHFGVYRPAANVADYIREYLEELR